MGKTIMIAAVMLFVQQGNLSAQHIEWQNTIGGSLADGLHCIRQTIDSGYICGGMSMSYISGDKTEISNGFQDYWVMKLDVNGDIQWQNTIGGSQQDILSFIEQTSDGGYICGGTSNSGMTGDKAELSQGLKDYWVIKLDAFGNIQWQNTIGGNEDDYLKQIHQTSDGGYICGGHSRSDISGDKTENSLGSEDYWIVKLDANGNIQWQNTIGGSVQDFLTSIEQTSDGGYICGGQSSSGISGDKTESNNNTDYWIIKLDASGNIQWQNTIGGLNYDVLNVILPTPEGGYFAGGLSYSPIGLDKTEGSIGYDCWVLKLDGLGNIEWQNTFGGDTSDYLITTELTHDGGYVCGVKSLSGFSNDKSEEGQGDNDFWVVKLDQNGRIDWQNNFGGSLSDQIYYLEETFDGAIICGGYSNSNISGDKNENSQGNSDFWVVKLWGKENVIQGKMYIDLNSNSLQDPGENGLSSRIITETNTGRHAYSRSNGNYRLTVLDSGNFVAMPPAVNYYNPVPGSHQVSFSGVLQADTSNDFAYQPTGAFNDLEVSITPTGAFRSGFTASYMINCINKGTTTANPVIIFYNDLYQSFNSSIPAAATVTSDSAVFNFGTLAPYQNGNILVTVNISPGLANGFVVNAGAGIYPVVNDFNPINNLDYRESIITGSFDPNDILVDTDTLFDFQLSSPPYLEYTIRFQNTGNDTAFYVSIENKIRPNLEINTFEYVASSHPCDMVYQTYDSTLKFIFNNILLPDSNVNEPQSHGFVRYRMKPLNTLTAGDSILNNAAIIFDYNAPVFTNMAVTHVVLPTSFPENTSSSDILVLYPNPANSTLTIETGHLSDSECRLVISDVTGRSLFSKLITSNSTKQDLDISSLSPGIYFVRVQSGERMYRGRFVKN